MARKKKASDPAPMPEHGEHTEKKPGGLLGKLMGKAAKTPEKPVAKKSTKPVITLEGAEAEVLDTFTSADAILKVAKSGQEAAKARAGEIVRAHYLRMCIEREYKPENPTVSSAHSKCNFQVKHVSKLRRQAAPNGEVLTVEDQLRQLGFEEDVVEGVSKVIKQKPTLGLKKFTDLMGDDATAAQRAVADKLMALVDEHLDEDEQALVLEQGIETTVDESWKDLAVKLAVKVGGGNTDRGVEALEKLYTVLPPQFVMAQMIFSGELSSAFASMSAEPPPEKKTIKSLSGRYEAVCEGAKMTLYIVKPDGLESVGTKNFDSAGHAENTVRRIFKEPEALAEMLSELKSSK